MDNESPLLPFPYGDRVYQTRMTAKFERHKPYHPGGKDKLLCVIPGLVRTILVREGEKVHEGQPLLILEAMKMHNEIRAPFGGTIGKIHATAGKNATKGELLIEFC